MTDKYIKYGKAAIFRDKSRDGLLIQFLKEYKVKFGGGVLNVDCSRCRAEYWNNYINSFKMKEPVKCDYELHKKYNGIQLGTNGQPIRNGEMTNEIAKELLDKHPHGAKLFSVIPVVEEIEVKEEVVVEKPKKRKRTPKKDK